MRWKACLLAAFAMLAPLLRAVDDPTYSGIDRKPLAMGLAASGPSVALTNIAGTAFDCIEQPDGKIVVVGNNQRTLLAMRFHANGATDTTFGDNGVFVLPNYDIWYEGGMGVALQSNGSIVLVTKTYFYTNPNGNGSGIVVRLTPAGQLDTSFAGSGVKLINGGDRAFLNRVFVTPDDKIVTGGNYPSGIWFARYLANGAEDATFGSNGKAFIQQATQNNHSGQVGQLVLLPDGKMLMLSVGILSATREAWVVDRVTATGALDPNFNRISLPYDGTNTYIGSMARLSDGRIAVVIPRSEPSYPVGDMVGLYSSEGGREGAVSDSAFAGGRGLGYWDNATALVVRSDGSLCGGMKESVVQFLPSLQKIVPGVTSYGYGLGLLEALLDGGLLRVKGSSVYRYAADGASGVTYTMSGTTNTTYPPDIVIEQLFSPITDGGSRSFGSAAVNGSPSTLTFTIRNTGLGSLKDLAISVTGTHAADFTVSALASTTVVSGSGQSFTVSFAPKATGARTAKLQIASNDPDENPFDITLTGQGSSSSPEIVVESPTSISDGGSVAFSSVNVGAPALTRTFTIRNAGQTNLTGLAISFTGDHAADFSATALTSSTLAPGGSQTFTLSFAPKAAGARTATMAIASNDGDENPFDIGLSGMGLGSSSVLEVAFSGGTRVDQPAQDVNLGSVNPGTITERNFTITNTSTSTSTALATNIYGVDAAFFSITPALPKWLAPGSSVTFAVRFSALLGGARSASVIISAGSSQVALLRFTATVVSVPGLEMRGPDGRRIAPSVQGVVGWGDDADSRASAPAGLTGATAVSAGYSHTMALKQDGTVAAWGRNFYGQTSFPAGLTGVTAIAAGYSHSAALRQDGTVVAWGSNILGETNVPIGLDHVVAIAVGVYHTVALRQDGTVVAWGNNYSGQTLVPVGLTGVTAIAAGGYHTIALKQDGTVIAWGYNGDGQCTIPAGLTGVVAIATGPSHALALKRDGTVVAWGSNYAGKATVPAGLADVVAISAGESFTVALKRDGKVVAWGDNQCAQIAVPAGIKNVVAISAGAYHTVAIGTPGIACDPAFLRMTSAYAGSMASKGLGPLTISRAVVEGPDAKQFSFRAAMPATVAVGNSLPFSVLFTPTHVGRMKATLNIYTNDPTANPFVLDLTGTGTFDIGSTKSSVKNSFFTYGPLTADPTTGLIVQKITFENPTKTPLNGLRLIVSNIAPGVTVNSSSVGEAASTVEVIYSKPIAMSEIVQFYLTYSDTKRRTTASIQPFIRAEALLDPEPRSEPVKGTLTPLLGVRDTAQGPLVEWNCKPKAEYVVEYSDDRGVTWFSAVHRLVRNATRISWVDRGQPETYTKPVNKAARSYRVKRL